MMHRRTMIGLLAAGTTAMAGCGFDQRVSSGDVQISNRDDSPHTVTVHLRQIDDGGQTETFQGTPPQRRVLTLDSDETRTLDSFIPDSGDWLLVAETAVGDVSREAVSDGACVVVEDGVGNVNIRPGELC
jgi:hypothetical protein